MVINVADALAAYQQSGAKKKGGDTGDVDSVGSFADTLSAFIGDGVKALKEAEHAAASGAVGKANLQEVVLAVGNAELMLQSFVTLRDRVIGAYQDIIRMPI